MKKIILATSLCAVFLSLPFVSFAMSHQEQGSHDHQAAVAEESHHGEMNHAGHGNSSGSHSQADGMSSDGSMMIVGSMVSKGVKGMAHIKDVSETMAKMGMQTTHHFMIAFVDEETGKQIEQGTVALKLTNPDAKVGDPIELIGMDGHFGADIVLDMEGEYHFRLGTKLEDGKKRKYHFHHVN
jgi:hypothetical protein